jgi:predicted 3-demethylubiquinone-9 3-methyltransferase (glyoxalase superfamily)
MKPIVPYLWFDTQAGDAARYYATVFPSSRITRTQTLREVPSPTGECEVVSFEVWDQPFTAISAGPLFRINPSISFFVNFDPSREKDARGLLDATWDKLSKGAKVLMPLDRYPFSQRYGWVQDRYGVSWQLILTDPEGEPRPTIVPSLLFTGNVAGRAEEASDFWMSVFPDSKRGTLVHHGRGQEPEREGTVMFSDFTLAGTWFAAMDSARDHDFAFNEAVSLYVPCETQEEIDFLWSKLSAVPDAEQCGWLKDEYGVSWQIASAELDDMLAQGSPEQVRAVTRAFLQMKKFEIDKLEAAYGGKAGARGGQGGVR